MKTREIQGDLIRVTAMIFVICAHSIQRINIFCSNRSIYTEILIAFFMLANPLFFMLSGKFNLRKEFNNKEDYTLFYTKRFISIIIPFVIYSLIIQAWNYFDDGYPILDGIYLFPKRFIAGKVDDHLWFMYPLIGMLISTPFLSKMARTLSMKELKVIIIISFLWNLISVVVQNIFEVSFAFSGWMFSDFFMYFFLGYVLDKMKIQKKCIFNLLALAVIFVVASAFQNYYFADNAACVFDYSPKYAFAAIVFYLFIDKCIVINNKQICKIINYFAKYSFSIYLLHLPILKIIVDIYDELNILKVLNNNISLLLTILGTLFVSLFISIIIDNSVVLLAKRFISNLLNKMFLHKN